MQLLDKLCSESSQPETAIHSLRIVLHPFVTDSIPHLLPDNRGLFCFGCYHIAVSLEENMTHN